MATKVAILSFLDEFSRKEVPDMRRIAAALAALFMIVILATGVWADSSVSKARVTANVATNGNCQVTLTATLVLEQSAEKLVFPIPADATNVFLNGSRARTVKNGNVREVDLSGIVGTATGTFSITIEYTLSDVITGTSKLQLELPLLSGFVYPLKALEFRVELPGAFPENPSFSSGYHQSDIQKDMLFTVSGAAVSGSFRTSLKDRETLTMTLPVSEEMFPQPNVLIQSTDLGDMAQNIFALLALVYWILFLRSFPIRARYSIQPPEGHSAGSIGCILSMQGVDLSTMVLTWAQLGYVLLRIERSGKVVLQKCMDMGNERPEAERRFFRKLFAVRATVDTSGMRFIELSRVAARKPVGIREMIHPRSGSLKLFRALASCIGLFGGINLAARLSDGAALQGFLIFLLAIAGAVSGWIIQGWGSSLFLRSKQKLWTSLMCCGIWLLLGALTDTFSDCLWIVIQLLLAGLLYAFGGRRSEPGRRAVSQVLGLRHYLRTIPKTELQRICNLDPGFFYTMLPYALALGVSKAFARRFGKGAIMACPYLSTGSSENLSAAQWEQRIAKAAAVMAAGSRQSTLDKLKKRIHDLTK